MSSGYHCFPYEHAHSAYFYCKTPQNIMCLAVWVGAFIYQTVGGTKRYVPTRRMTSYPRLTSTQNRSRFLQAYTLYFLHCNKHFVHTFFNMVCLKPRELAAVKEYP